VRYSIGLGLALNILFWLGLVAIVCCAEVFVIKEFLPRSYPKKPKHGRVGRARHPRTPTGIHPG